MSSETPKPEKRRRGPVANPNTLRTTVVLDRTLADWGKKQPGGLSAILRQCLEERRAQADG